MTKQQILKVVADYRSFLLSTQSSHSNANVWAEPADYDLSPTRLGAINHMLYMCDLIEAFVAEDRIEKAMRWLGFIQGTLWMMGSFTLNEMREHNTQETGDSS